MVDANRRFRAVRFNAYSVGRDEYALLSLADRSVQRCSAGCVQVLQVCRVGRSLSDHVEEVDRSLRGSFDRSSVQALIDGLVTARLLVPLDDAEIEAPASVPEHCGRITTLGVVTADRPEPLKRCLESYTRHCAQNSSGVRFLVIDGSRQVATQQATYDVVSESRRTSGVEIQYIGDAERRTLREVLIAKGFAPATVTFAIPDPIPAYTAGASRNLLLLLTAGEGILSVDDDTICSVWADPHRHDGLSLYGHEYPCDMSFFSSRDEAVSAIQPANADLVGAHSELLGTPLSFLAKKAQDGIEDLHSCDHLTAAIVEKEPRSRVRMTFAGIAGDSAQYCGHQLLFARGKTRSTMATSRVAYERALFSREAHCIVRRLTVVHEGFCLTYCAGMDNRSLLPPFLPIFGNEDGVFGATLTFCDPFAFFGYLPFGIVHDSSRQSARNGRPMSMSLTRISDVMTALIANCPISKHQVTLPVRMERLGQYFCELSAVDVHDLMEVVFRTLLERRCYQFLWADSVAQHEFAYPDHWKDAVADVRETFLRKISRPEFFLPVECSASSAIEDGFLEVQRLLSQFGRLLKEWSDIWIYCRDILPME